MVNKVNYHRLYNMVIFEKNSRKAPTLFFICCQFIDLTCKEFPLPEPLSFGEINSALL